jgi:hypothetical protein
MNDSHSWWDPDLIGQAHRLYEQLTAQSLPLHLERQRQWALIFSHGYTLEDLRRLIGYLQREIRAGRRYVGALKLSNLLQLERFEEDLALSRVRLRPPEPPANPPSHPSPPKLDPAQIETDRQRGLEILRQFRRTLRQD